MDEKNVNNNLENENNNNQDPNNMNVGQPTNTENPYYNPYFQENGEQNSSNDEYYNQPGQGMNQILAGSVPKVTETIKETQTTDDSVNLFDLDNAQNVSNNVDNNYQDNYNMNYNQQEQNNYDMSQPQVQDNYNMNYQPQVQDNYNMNYQEQNNMNYQNPVQDNLGYQTEQNTKNKKNGKKSVPIILIIIILLLIVGIVIAAIIFVPKMVNKPQENNNIEDNNIVDEPVTNFAYFKFYENYGFDYNSEKWGANLEDAVLTSGNYKLKYIQSLENLSNIGYDIKMPTDRASFFTFLYDQFSSQADVSTTTVELGTSNFTLKNNAYYAYLDLVYGTSIERCYFILLPDEDMFIEFILSNEDTVISDEINNEVIDYICNIYLEGTTNEVEDNTIGNQTTNDTLDNIIDNTTDLNGTMNNTSNETNINTTDTNVGIGNATTGGIVLSTPNR